MNPRWLAVIVMSLFFAGCERRVSHDSGPTIFGITPALRIEIEKLVKAYDTNADSRLVADEFLNRIVDAADGAGIRPGSAGDYRFPPMFQKIIDEELDGTNATDIPDMVAEYGIELPPWALPLVVKCQNGTASRIHRELLLKITLIHAIPLEQNNAE